MSAGPTHPFTVVHEVRWRKQLDADHELAPGARLTGGNLVTHVNKQTGIARPSFNRMASLGGVAQSTVIRHINDLVDRGHLGIERRGGRHLSNLYWPVLHTQKTVALVQELPDQKLSQSTTENSSTSENRTYLSNPHRKKGLNGGRKEEEEPVDWAAIGLQPPRFKQRPYRGDSNQYEAPIKPVTFGSSQYMAAVDELRAMAAAKFPTTTPSTVIPPASRFLLSAMRTAATLTSSE